MVSESKVIHVAVITLGCSKNLVDAECMTRILIDAGFLMVTEISAAEVIVVNTCGFIESAKKEAIDTILEAAEYKKPSGIADYIIVTGCLSQRYPDDILKDLPEVDAVLGTNHYGEISQVISGLYSGDTDGCRRRVSEPGGLSHMRKDRILSTSSFAWLKIAEGCSNACAYCAIPAIRGKYSSRKIEDILDEAKIISSGGVSEIILTAQDTTNYGIDLYSERMLPVLLRELSKIEQISSIRIMYAYMEGITDQLLDEMISNPKILHYLDIPVQHGDDGVLTRMGRRDSVELISERLDKIRLKIPDIVIRSTVMVGFPGETEIEYENLLLNIQKWKFDRLGCFIYSAEENTRAFLLPDQIDPAIAQERYNRIMQVQQDISLGVNQGRIGSIVSVTIDSISDDGIFYSGRSYAEAPEVDPMILVLATGQDLQIGNQYPVRLVDCSPYEMTGVTINEFAE